MGQKAKPNPEKAAINKTIIGFLQWYKLRLNDTAKKSYTLLKGGYPDTTTQRRINWGGVEVYLTELKESNFVSESFVIREETIFLILTNH